MAARILRMTLTSLKKIYNWLITLDFKFDYHVIEYVKVRSEGTLADIIKITNQLTLKN
jgi:hypothetical protein